MFEGDFWNIVSVVGYALAALVFSPSVFNLLKPMFRARFNRSYSRSYSTR